MVKDDMKRPPPATTLHNVPDELLRRILWRIGTPVTAIRAAATCKQWRRHIAANTRLLVHAKDPRRHPIAGNYHNRASPPNGPVFVPSSPAALGDVVDSRHFSLDFLPGGGRAWEVADSDATMLLLRKKTAGWWKRRCFPDLTVCEPVTRRYKLLPRLEEMRRHRCVGVYLCASVANWASGLTTMSEFRVTCMLYEQLDGLPHDDVGAVTPCVFDRYMKSSTTIDLCQRPGWCVKKNPTPLHVRGANSLRFIGRNKRTLFFYAEEDDGSSSVLTFNDEFSPFELPDLVRPSTVRVITSQVRRIMTIISLQGSSLRVFDLPLYGDGAAQWVLRKSLEMMEAAKGLAGYKEEYFHDGALEIVTAGMTSAILASTTEAWLFSLDLDTMEVAKCRTKTKDYASVVPFPSELPWPPVFHACKVPRSYLYLPLN